MNERILELAGQAGMGHERWNTTAQFESFLEKFAELIVRECISICKEKERANLYGIREVEATIKTHFGVEE